MALLQDSFQLKIRLFCSQDGKKEKKEKTPKKGLWAVNTSECIFFLLYENHNFFFFPFSSYSWAV